MRGHVFLARWKRDILCRYRAKDWHSRKSSQIPAHYGRRNGFYESADVSANALRIPRVVRHRRLAAHIRRYPLVLVYQQTSLRRAAVAVVLRNCVNAMPFRPHVCAINASRVPVPGYRLAVDSIPRILYRLCIRFALF